MDDINAGLCLVKAKQEQKRKKVKSKRAKAPKDDGTNGQDRKSYTDTQDRKNYHV